MKRLLLAIAMLFGVSVSFHAAETNAPPTQMYTRYWTVRLDKLKRSTGSAETNTVTEVVPRFLKQTGVELKPPTAWYWKYRLEMLMVRASLADLERIENALSKLDERK